MRHLRDAPGGRVTSQGRPSRLPLAFKSAPSQAVRQLRVRRAHGRGRTCQATQARWQGASELPLRTCSAAAAALSAAWRRPRQRGTEQRVRLLLAAQAEKPKASAPSEDDLDAAYAALADARGVITAASLLAKSSELNLGWKEEDTRHMLQLFGAGRSLSRAEFAQVAAAVKARTPKR